MAYTCCGWGLVFLLWAGCGGRYAARMTTPAKCKEEEAKVCECTHGRKRGMVCIQEWWNLGTKKSLMGE